jgi:hypothetical protein
MDPFKISDEPELRFEKTMTPFRPSSQKNRDLWMNFSSNIYTICKSVETFTQRQTFAEEAKTLSEH